jgi:hypothetical protein
MAQRTAMASIATRAQFLECISRPLSSDPLAREARMRNPGKCRLPQDFETGEPAAALKSFCEATQFRGIGIMSCCLHGPRRVGTSPSHHNEPRRDNRTNYGTTLLESAPILRALVA